MFIIADNVLSPLGETTADNYQAIRRGCSSLKHYTSLSGRPEDDYVASQFSQAQREKLMLEEMTWFESLVCQSVRRTLSQCQTDVTTDKTLFVLSTTKANIDTSTSQSPAESASRIAALLGIKTPPLVVCNACISGVSAIITAQRLLQAGFYDTAIVAGCDVISHFVVSGFQSLKALSQQLCRPFDIERLGLNLGEAAATIILSNRPQSDKHWAILRGAVRNDAYHISSPSPKAAGCTSAIQYVTDGIDKTTLGAVNVHGTATMYNDQMESRAIEASGLSAIPANTLKGALGHTLGASGILETIITMHSIEHGTLLPTIGFSEIGVSGRINISSHAVAISQPSFVKIISGFGGNNAAMLCQHTSRFKVQSSKFSDQGQSDPRVDDKSQRLQPFFLLHQPSSIRFHSTHHVHITPQCTRVDGKSWDVETTGSMLTALYKRYVRTYPRFHKMDRLCQLGFVASELLLSQEHPRHESCADRAVILFNHSSSTWADKAYQQTIKVGENYFPSPSLFVYTLPNIVCGEIALRNSYHAETTFYIMNSKDEAMMSHILQSAFADQTHQSAIAGWIDYVDEDMFEADLKLIVKI